MELLTLQQSGFGYGVGSAADRVLGVKIPAILGVEAQWSFNGILLNQYNWIDTYLLKSIDGLGDSDIRDSREVNPEEHGETPFNSLYGGSTIVFNGKIQTRTLNKLRNMERALRQSFSPLVEMPLIQRTGDLSRDLFTMCKKHQPMVKGEEQTTPNHYERTFQISLRASNPWFVSYLEQYLDTGFTAGEASLNVTNIGDFESQPIIEITGPANSGLEIYNFKNNHIIILKVAIPGGDTYKINTANSLVTDQDNNIIYGVIDSDSNDFRIAEDGKNLIEVSAGGTDGNSLVAIKWRHTYKI